MKTTPPFLASLYRTRANSVSRRPESHSNRAPRRAAVEGLEARTLLAVTPAGPEFRVNTRLASSQAFPAMAMDAAGDFVVAWQGNNQDDGFSNGIFAQRYNAAGVAQGAEFLVNTTVRSNQTKPQVAMDAVGDFVIAWESPDASDSGVFARRYNAAGVAQGGEFHVNTFTTGFQNTPKVAMDADGDFVVAWTSYNQEAPLSAGGVYAQRYSKTGAAVGTEFRANTFTPGYQRFPTVAMDAAGDFVIAWESAAQDPDASNGIYAQRYSPAGATVGAEFRVNSYTVGNQNIPSAAMDVSGDFVIVWHGSNPEGGFAGVHAQRFDAAGGSQGPEIRANTTRGPQERYTTVAMDADGDFVISWQNEYGDANLGKTSILAQRYTAAGAPVDGEFQVNTTTLGNHRYPAAAMDADGDFAIAWASYGQDAGDTKFDSGVYAQRYAPSRLLGATQVFAGGSTWTAPFKTALQTQGIGSSRFGYTIGGGAAQLLTVPWSNVNQISISFSGDVQADMADLAVRGVNVASYPVTGFAYEPITHTGTWTLGRSIGNDNIILDLDGDAPNGVRAAGAGGQLLDGDWATGGTYPSGNGTAGGDFRFRVNVLPGDVTRDGRVNALDLSDAKRRLNRTPGDGVTSGGAFSAFADIDGGGRINALDISAIKQRLNQTSPPGLPAGLLVKASSATRDLLE